MKNLENENLISGVSTGASRDEEVERQETDESVSPEEPESDPGADVPASGTVDRIVERVCERLDERMKAAEERGYRRAMEEIRQRREALGLDNSVPNFLADIRRDVWD